MKIKFLLIAISFAMMFAACGSKEPTVTEPVGTGVENESNESVNEPVSEEEPQISIDITPVESDEEFPSIDPNAFSNALDEFTTAYDGLVDILEFMVIELRAVDTDEDFDVWYDTFIKLHEYVGLTIEMLVEIEDFVPEEHADYFVSFRGAMDVLYEAMASFEFALSDVSIEDESAVAATIEEFEAKMASANALIRGE